MLWDEKGLHEHRVLRGRSGRFVLWVAHEVASSDAPHHGVGTQQTI